MLQRESDGLPMSPLPEPAIDEAKARLAARMKALRGHYGESQGAAAERAGIKEWDWQRIEAQTRDAQLTDLIRIQYAYGVRSLEDFLGEPPSKRLFQEAASESKAEAETTDT